MFPNPSFAAVVGTRSLKITLARDSDFTQEVENQNLNCDLKLATTKSCTVEFSIRETNIEWFFNRILKFTIEFRSECYNFASGELALSGA